MKQVFLKRNICIDEVFDNPERIVRLPQIVSEKCGFPDASKPIMSSHVFDLDCGKVEFSTGFVIGGNKTERGQWPFLVALYSLEKNSFLCGGSLITSRHVLTGGKRTNLQLI